MKKNITIAQHDQFKKVKDCFTSLLPINFEMLWILYVPVMFFPIYSLFKDDLDIFTGLLWGGAFLIITLALLVAAFIEAHLLLKTTYVLKDDSIHVYNKKKIRILYEGVRYISENKECLTVFYTYKKIGNSSYIHIFITDPLIMEEARKFLDTRSDLKPSVIISRKKFILPKYIRDRESTPLTKDLMKVED